MIRVSGNICDFCADTDGIRFYRYPNPISSSSLSTASPAHIERVSVFDGWPRCRWGAPRPSPRPRPLRRKRTRVVRRAPVDGIPSAEVPARPVPPPDDRTR